MVSEGDNSRYPEKSTVSWVLSKDLHWQFKLDWVRYVFVDFGFLQSLFRFIRFVEGIRLCVEGIEHAHTYTYVCPSYVREPCIYV